MAERTELEVYIDGACEPINPGGIAAWGAYIKHDNGVIEEWGVIGQGDLMSNNVAEYGALLNALGVVKKTFGTDVDVRIYSDSQLVVNQMKRAWQMKSGLYFDMAQKALHFATQFPSITYTWIPRERNTFADALSRRSYTLSNRS
jgi:ribonuclease HI